MAVATPVLERQFITDEEHNARIGQNYARLINPENRIEEALGRNVNTAVVEEAAPVVEERRTAYAEQPAFVENARADSAIFRADSEINQRLAAEQNIISEQDSEEDENEDLRPTLTTIQYKTSGVKKTVEEGKIENTGVEKRAGLSKRDKIVIAAIVSVVLVMLVLIIVNAAVLSSVNGDVSSLQSSLTTIKASYEGVKDEITPYLNLTEDDLSRIALQFGWVNG